MLAINILGGGPVSNYAVIASNDASDVFVQQRNAGPVSHANEFVWVADNASFLNLREIGTPDILYVTNGSIYAPAAPMNPGNHESPPDGPGFDQDPRDRRITNFSLANGNIANPTYLEDIFGDPIRRTLPPPPSNPVPFMSELYLLDADTPAIYGTFAYAGRSWNVEVVPNSGMLGFRPAEYDAILNATFAQNSLIVSVPNTTGLAIGMRVYGDGIRSNTTITAIAANQIILSQLTTIVGTNTPLGFVNLNGVAEPLSGSFSFGNTQVESPLGRGERGHLSINWSADVSTVAVAGNPNPPQMREISYGFLRLDAFGNRTVAIQETNFYVSPVDLDAPVNPRRSETTFTFDAGAPLGVINGTVRGTLTIDGVGRPFATDFTRGNTVFFPLNVDDDGNALTYDDFDWVRVRARFQPGELVLEFTNAFEGFALPIDEVPVLPRFIELTNISYFVYDQDANPNTFTVTAGHDLTSQLEVELLTSGSRIVIDSNVAITTSLNDSDSAVEDVVLRATTIDIRAQVASRDIFRVQRGRGDAIAETLRVDAPVAAPQSFIIDMADDPGTSPSPGTAFDGPERGLISLSESGSFSGALSPSPQTVTVPTETITIRGEQTDIYVAGQIFGTKQTYLLNSTVKAQDLAPYIFSTSAERTGTQAGLIRGDVVAITLGNDAPTPLDGSIAYNTLDLSTQVDSLRITAATQQQPGSPPGPSPSGPFPYNLSIREFDDISIDAVAASGLPLSITSGGSMRFTSALATANDLTLQTSSADASAPAFLTVSAPLSTTRGTIRLIGDGVTLNNSVVVSGSDQDEYRDEIWITANAGDVALSGLVSATNRIKIQQRSTLAPTGTPYRLPPGLGDTIVDLSTETFSISVPDDFSFDDLEVSLRLFHVRPSDLRATLIAPSGQRIRLFDRLAVTLPPFDDNAFVDTIFDSEAATSINQGTPPFTGRFAPLDSLAPLYSSSALGTWRLEIVDAVVGPTLPVGSTTAGFLETFGLNFIRAQGANALAKVSGTGRLVADEVLLDVQGSVGNPTQLPTDTNFYLRTNVNELSGSVGYSAAIEELNDINVRQLRAGGLVSLRALGVDPAMGRNAGQPALRASLIDITALDVAAPNGSVDVFFDTSRTIELGNAAGLRSGRSFNSLAAGDVKIRSNAGSLVVLDAPVAGGNARTARVASEVDLSTPRNAATNALVQYTPGVPGVTPSSLRGRGNLNAWFGVQVEPLRIGDRVLIKDQAKPESNGVYTLTFMSTNGWMSTTTWTLLRSGDSDTAAEFADNTIVNVGEPQANVDQVGTWQVTANYLPLNGATLTSISYASGDTNLSVLNTSDLRLGMAVYGPGIADGTTIDAIDTALDVITLSQPTTAASSGSGETLRFVGAAVRRWGATTAFSLDDIYITGLASTADLAEGMLVVGTGVPAGTVITRILDGSTVVLSDSVTDPFTGYFSFLTPFAVRTGNVAADGVTVSGLTATGDLRQGMLVVGLGIDANTTIQTIVNATTITLSPQQFPTQQTGVVLNFLAAMPTNFGLAPITITPRPVTTDIGANDTSSIVSYVVSTSAGTNSSAGSLGKMISLRQQNIAAIGGDPANASQVLPATYAPASNVMTVPSSAGLLGLLVYDFDPDTYGDHIPEGTLVTRILDARTVELSRRTTGGATGNPVSFVQRQKTAFAFSEAVATNLTPIRLTQELPEITQPLTLDGSNLYPAAKVTGQPGPPLIDGSRITLTRSNRGVRSGDTVSGLVISGPAAAGTTVSNVNLGGFARVSNTNTQSAAIDVRDTPGVLVRNVALGGSELGVRLGNGIGVRFTGAGTTSGTILNSDIFGSDDSGITVTNGASGVSVVGTTLGRLGMENKVGARFESGVNQFGVDPATHVQQIPPVQATRVAANRFTLPASFQQQALRLTAGVRILGPAVVPSTVGGRTTIAAISINPRSGVATVTVAGGSVTGSGEVTFIPAITPPSIPEVLAFPRNAVSFTLSAGSKATAGLIYPGMAVTGTTIQADPATPTVPVTVASIVIDPRTNVATITLAGGTISGTGRVAFGAVVHTTLNQRTVTLPETVNFDNLFLGQRVSGTGIPAGTVITAMDRATRTLTFAEDKLFTRTGFTVLTFEAGGRNTVAQNRFGLVLAGGGATTVTNTTISANAFNGIEITGSGTVGGRLRHHRIGTSFGPTAGSNQIFGNGGWGVFFASGVPESVKRGVIVRGNYLGTTTVTLDASSLSNRKGNVGHVTNREEVFAGLAGELGPRAIDGIDVNNNQHMVNRPPARPIVGQPWRRR